MIIHILIGVLMSGQVVVLDAFGTNNECQSARAYILHLDERPANVFCSKMFVRDY